MEALYCVLIKIAHRNPILVYVLFLFFLRAIVQFSSLFWGQCCFTVCAVPDSFFYSIPEAIVLVTFRAIEDGFC